MSAAKSKGSASGGVPNSGETQREVHKRLMRVLRVISHVLNAFDTLF